MKKLAIMLAASTFLVGAAHAETLRVGTSADFAPWESVDASGAIVGFDIDVANEICTRIEAECEFTNQAFDGLLPSLQVGKFDLVISGLSITDERAAQIDFSSAYAEPPYRFAAAAEGDLAGIGALPDLEAALAGKTIGVQTGSTHEAVIRAHFPSSDVRLYERNDQIADDLTAGRLDAGLLEESVWGELIKDRAQLAVTGPSLTSANYPEFGKGTAIALKKGNSKLKARVDGAVAEILADGTVVELSNKWFGYDIAFKAAQ